MLFAVWLFSAITLIAPQQQEPSIAAIVDDYEISLNRIERFLTKRLGRNKLSTEAMRIAKNEAVDHLVNRHVVLKKIVSEGINVGPSQIAIEFSRLSDRLAEVDQDLDDYLQVNKLNKTELEYEFRWRLAWKEYLKRQLTNERLGAYYDRFHRKFDGTEMQVAHILLSKEKHGFELAQEIKDQIDGGSISWRQAAKKYSIATTSANNGGEIGWITYAGPMVPKFCQAAMELDAQEISQPIETKFGIHLIKCLDIRDGKIGKSDAIEQVRTDATQYLFDSIAKKNRGNSIVDIRIK